MIEAINRPMNRVQMPEKCHVFKLNFVKFRLAMKCFVVFWKSLFINDVLPENSARQYSVKRSKSS
jgi:hypothetical protein